MTITTELITAQIPTGSAPTEPAPAAQPMLRVVRGEPNEWEVAALIAGLTAVTNSAWPLTGYRWPGDNSSDAWDGNALDDPAGPVTNEWALDECTHNEWTRRSRPLPLARSQAGSSCGLRWRFSLRP